MFRGVQECIKRNLKQKSKVIEGEEMQVDGKLEAQGAKSNQKPTRRTRKQLKSPTIIKQPLREIQNSVNTWKT